MGYTGEQKRAYQRQWLANRRLQGLALLGNRCYSCGCTQDLEFDHIDPATKDPKIKGDTRQGFPWSWSWNRIEIELSKCQLLCEDCHKQKTRVDIPTPRYCPQGHDTELPNGRKPSGGCRACAQYWDREIRIR